MAKKLEYKTWGFRICGGPDVFVKNCRIDIAICPECGREIHFREDCLSVVGEDSYHTECFWRNKFREGDRK